MLYYIEFQSFCRKFIQISPNQYVNLLTLIIYGYPGREESVANIDLTVEQSAMLTGASHSVWLVCTSCAIKLTDYLLTRVLSCSADFHSEFRTTQAY